MRGDLTFELYMSFVHPTKSEPVIYKMETASYYDDFRKVYKLDFLPDDPLEGFMSEDDIIYYSLVEPPWDMSILVLSQNLDKLTQMMVGIRTAFNTFAIKEQQKRTQFCLN